MSSDSTAKKANPDPVTEIVGVKAGEILDMVTRHSLERFKVFCQQMNAQLLVAKIPDVSSIINRRSEIFLYGSDLTLRLQLFYSDILFQSQLQHIFSQVTPRKVQDFFDELCNLSCGKMKEVFEEQGVPASLSLPVSAKTNRSAMISEQEVLNYMKFWKVMLPQDGHFFIKVSLEIHRSEVVEKLKLEPLASSDTKGKIEFF